MPDWQQIAVGAAVVAKMYPNYALFCDLTNFANATKFDNILKLVWEYASGVNAKIDFEKQQLKLDLLTPDPQDFDMYGVWPALDAVTGLSSLLSACNKWDASEIAALLTLSTSTISSYLDLIADNDESINVEDHLLYQEHEQYVAHVISALKDDLSKSGREQTIKKLKSSSATIEHSNIGLSVSG